MKYLPILDELISSDLIYIFIIGIGASIIFVSLNKNRKKNIIAMIAAFAIYIGCEVLCNIVYNFLFTFILILVGSFALGFAMCLLITYIIVSIRKN